jgi:hypothetical protein
MSNIQSQIRNLYATTNGKGFWSSEQRTVKINKITIEEIVDDNYDSMDANDSTKTPHFMDLRVYFSKKSWNVEKHGLIYTDDKWMSELRKGLRSIGLETAGLDYTEQGMQGDDYVSVCVGNKKTIRSLIKALSKPVKVAKKVVKVTVTKKTVKGKKEKTPLSDASFTLMGKNLPAFLSMMKIFPKFCKILILKIHNT